MEPRNDQKPSSPALSAKSDLDDSEPTVVQLAATGVPVRDPKYYIDEQMSIFLVDNHLFRVHRHFLRRESLVFDTMFNCPPPVEGQEGQADESPIALPDVSRNEFIALMDYFYQGSFFLSQSGSTIPLQEHIDLLSIASRYDCPGARLKAIQGIESQPLDPIQKLILSEKYNVQEWLMPAYIEICKRDKPLTKDEAVQIGLEKVMLIAEAREIARSSPESRDMIYNHYYNHGNNSWPGPIFEHSRLERIINESLATKLPSITSTSLGGKKKKKVRA
ncbi:hypothetical protein E1B28_006531 [Marasmius oreades]|uniref:BTB domain-containing protein n=1 Tax=Marasmius oreades TaxID=181124 RepID=A0A9P7UW73_9AGAR|nr:uncharacterized protein E1B28_006531 [Marasmius oreades]KAG7095836.1 hypothetical protein E1B28_006531 [Marasmius oreades]